MEQEFVYAPALPEDWRGLRVSGLGVDTASVARLARSLRRPSFVERVYGPQEAAALRALPPARQAQSAAAAWAAKEAFGKALGSGLAGLALREVQVLHDAAGAPYLAFCGGTAEKLAARGLAARLSLTHEGGFATAFVAVGYW